MGSFRPPIFYSAGLHICFRVSTTVLFPNPMKSTIRIIIVTTCGFTHWVLWNVFILYKRMPPSQMTEAETQPQPPCLSRWWWSLLTHKSMVIPSVHCSSCRQGAGYTFTIHFIEIKRIRVYTWASASVTGTTILYVSSMSHTGTPSLFMLPLGTSIGCFSTEPLTVLGRSPFFLFRLGFFL